MPGTKDGLTDRKELGIINVSLRKLFVNTSLLEKTCKKCGKSFPRNTEYFYGKKHHSIKNTFLYSSYCIACDNKRTAKYKKVYYGRRKETDLIYRRSEHGYFMGMWQSVKKSRHGCHFKNFEEFFNVWKEQQKTYGNKCPYLNIEMTRIVGNLNMYNQRATPTNISKDRIDCSKPYSPQNLMFVSWRANNTKGSVTPMIAKRYLGFYKERFGDGN
tara:strand:+ start:155 stop:799 length:645 start_codon:yes stop_codon:yes gene_type:complete